MTFYVHETSVVDENVNIGKGTKVWHWTHICSGVDIGSDCTIGQGVFIAPGVKIGNHVKIQNNVSVYSGITIEDGVFCGPSMVFTNVINPRAEINKMPEALPTLVKHGASIGANATIVCGNTIGKYSMIGAGTVVTTDVPDFALIIGVPGRAVAWVSRLGNKLDLPLNGHGYVNCGESSIRYKLNGNKVTEVGALD